MCFVRVCPLWLRSTATGPRCDNSAKSAATQTPLQVGVGKSATFADLKNEAWKLASKLPLYRQLEVRGAIMRQRPPTAARNPRTTVSRA